MTPSKRDKRVSVPTGMRVHETRRLEGIAGVVKAVAR